MAPSVKTSIPFLRNYPEMIGGSVVLIALYLISLYRYVLFHSLVEMFSIVIACGVFMVYWNSRRFLSNGYFLFVGIAYLFVGCLDLLHTLSYKGMGVFSANDGNLANQLWIAARYLESLSFVAACIFLHRRFNVQLVASVYATVVALILGSIFLWGIFPDCFIDGIGVTTFKTCSEIIICAILVASIFLLVRRKADFNERVFRLLLGSLVVTIASELSFSYYTNPYGPANLLGHLFKLVSFYLLYRAFIEEGLKRPYDLIFRDLRQATFCLEQAGDSIFWIDPEGQVVFANQKACEILEYSKEELQAMTVFDIDAVISREWWGPHWEAIQKKHSFVVESCHRTKTGHVFPVEVSVNYMTCDGKEYNCAFARDISDRKRTEQELTKAKQTAETASRSKSEFLANMSHEIRTPMTAILGFADILLENSVTQEATESAQIIKRNGEHLLNVINDILDLSKIEAGKCTVDLQECSPHQMAAEVISLMKVRADAKGLPLTLEVQGNIPARITTDPIRLRQILVNLVGNAIKFTEVGGVQIATRLDKASEGNAKLIFDVIDTGIGMSEEQTGVLFQPFSQVDGSAGRRFGGTGLGLAISKRLAGLLGGDISVSSIPGIGSTFSVTVSTGPLHDVTDFASSFDSVDPPKPPTNTRKKLNCRILLAEDGPDNQRLITFLLRKAGAEVAVAENGQIALDLALKAEQAGNPFEMILLDMQMPVMDGYEAARTLHTVGYQGPIIALTAHAMSEDRQKCLDAGCDDYISKPVDPKELLAILETWVDTPSVVWQHPNSVPVVPSDQSTPEGPGE